MKKPRPITAAEKRLRVESYLVESLRKIERGQTLVSFVKGTRVFAQGDAAKAVFFIHTGKVKLTVVSATGKEAILAVLGPSAFLGEACLAGGGGTSQYCNSDRVLDSVP